MLGDHDAMQSVMQDAMNTLSVLSMQDSVQDLVSWARQG